MPTDTTSDNYKKFNWRFCKMTRQYKACSGPPLLNVYSSNQSCTDSFTYIRVGHIVRREGLGDFHTKSGFWLFDPKPPMCGTGRSCAGRWYFQIHSPREQNFNMHCTPICKSLNARCALISFKAFSRRLRRVMIVKLNAKRCLIFQIQWSLFSDTEGGRSKRGRRFHVRHDIVFACKQWSHKFQAYLTEKSQFLLRTKSCWSCCSHAGKLTAKPKYKILWETALRRSTENIPRMRISFRQARNPVAGFGIQFCGSFLRLWGL